MTVTYDTRESSNQNLGIGLGCNGVIDVFIEPLMPEDAYNPIHTFQQFVDDNHPVVLASVFNSQAPAIKAGQKTWIGADGKLSGTLVEPELRDAVFADLVNVLKTKKSHVKNYSVQGQEVQLFLELVQPLVSLLIFGAGFDARPVSVLAKSMGWNVNVTDECVAHIAPVFFPTADKLSLCDRTFIERDFQITSYTACLLMSHNYEYDRDVLKKIIQSETPYIGMLGPRKRFDKMKAEMEAAGFEFTDELLRKVHSPVGLDIGAETPDEIAVSIIAEIQAKFTTRSGGFLKYKQGPIHERVGDQVFKQVFLGDADDATHAVGA
jgi:xanthine/CO dehydrogenase XdhC/CoxF family maturation factor